VIDDLPERYHDYLGRFAQTVGEVKVGAFAKYNGKLIKKMSFEEFTPAYVEYTEMLVRYRETVENGDTVNDLVLRMLRDHAATLILTAPG
jgi:hypothetical protein